MVSLKTPRLAETQLPQKLGLGARAEERNGISGGKLHFSTSQR